MGFLGHRRARGSLLLVLLMLAVYLFVLSIGELKSYRFIGGGVPATNTITVTGEGEVLARPDIASFTFSVIEQKQTVKEAQDEATRKMNIALELIRQAEIAEEDIKTTAYNIFPRYEYRRFPCTEFSCPPGRSELIGYEVSQTVAVKVRDIEKAGEILAEVGSVGVSNISNLDLAIDEEEELKREARAMAIDDAKENIISEWQKKNEENRSQEQLQAFFSQNASQLFDLDEAGRVRVDPISGDYATTPKGEAYFQAEQEAQYVYGLTDKLKIHRFAAAAIEGMNDAANLGSTEETSKSKEDEELSASERNKEQKKRFLGRCKDLLKLGEKRLAERAQKDVEFLVMDLTKLIGNLELGEPVMPESH